MPKITQQQAKEFLNSINNQDKIAIIHHDDLDGFASGILLYDFCEKKQANQIKNFVFSFGGWNKNITLNEFDKILIADIAPFGIKEINLPLNKKIFYTDHHPEKEEIPKEILELRTPDQEYIPSSRTVQELTNSKLWLGLAGTISDAGDLHKENNQYIESGLKNLKTTSKEFQKNIVHTLSNTIVYFDKNPEKAFEKIKNIQTIQDIKDLEKYSQDIETEIQEKTKSYEKYLEKINNINIVYLELKYPVRAIISTKVSMGDPEKIFIFLSKDQSNPEILGISSRHQADNADLPKLLNSAMKNLENAFAGGHKRAAGGQIQAKDLEKFKQNLKNFSEASLQ